MNKKAQTVMQVLIFILAALVFMMIVAYGYKAIKFFAERQEQVLIADFHTDLRLAVESVKRQPGTVRKLQLNLPSSHRGVCFFGEDCGEGAELVLPDQVIDMGWAFEACRRTGANVFLYPRVGSEPRLDIKVSDSYVCIPNIQGVTLRLEGVGRYAKVSNWQT